MLVALKAITVTVVALFLLGMCLILGPIIGIVIIALFVFFAVHAVIKEEKENQDKSRQ